MPAPPIERTQRNVALLVAGVLFMQMLDGTIVTTSAPRIARALHVSAGSIALVITAYLATVAVLVPLSGWLAARFGARATFLAAVAIFTVGSVGCGLSASFPELVTMRVLQAVGGAMMVPVGRLVVLSRADSSNLMRLTSLLVWPGLIAPVVAPLLGGVITTYASWHWLFLINLPLGVLALLIAIRIVHAPKLPPPGQFDLPGLLLVGLGLGGLTYSADLLAKPSLSFVLLASVGLPALLFSVVALAHLKRVSSPLVELRLIRIASFRSALIGTIFYWVAINAVPFLAPVLFEEVFHWSAVKAGSVVLFIFVGNLAAKLATTFLYSRFGFRPMLIASTSTLAFSLALLGLAGTSAPIILVALILTLSGVARSVGATGYTTLVYSDVPQAEMRHANTLVTTVQQLGGSWGVALGAIALRVGTPVGSLFGATSRGHSAYTVAFAVLACVALAATAEALRMNPHAGDALRGRHTPAVAPAGRNAS